MSSLPFLHIHTISTIIIHRSYRNSSFPHKLIISTTHLHSNHSIIQHNLSIQDQSLNSFLPLRIHQSDSIPSRSNFIHNLSKLRKFINNFRIISWLKSPHNNRTILHPFIHLFKSRNIYLLQYRTKLRRSMQSKLRRRCNWRFLAISQSSRRFIVS